MSMVTARFKDGMFQPITPVDLPDDCEVQFEPQVVDRSIPSDALQRIYSIMSRRHESGESDVAERHNEHQP